MSIVMMSQLVGFVGIVFFILSFQIKSNKALFLCQILGSMAFVIQYIMLGAFSGCYSLIVIIIRNFLLYKYRDWAWVRNKIWVPIFIGIFALIMWRSWIGPLSILPFAAATACTIGYWSDNARNIRIANLFVGSPSWIVYDFFVKAYIGIGSELFMMGSILVSIYRYGWKNLGSEDSEF